MIKQAVGNDLVGYGRAECFPGSLGIDVSVNAIYRVHELELDDRLAPSEYLQAWKATTGGSAYQRYDIYCPAVTTAQLARLYGVQFVLEPKDASAPQGAVFDNTSGTRRSIPSPERLPPPSPPYLDRPNPRTRGPRHSRRRRPAGVRDVEVDDQLRGVQCPPLAPDRRSGLARHDRRAALGPGALLGHHAPSSNSRWSAHHRTALLARDVAGDCLGALCGGGTVLVPIGLSLRLRLLRRRGGCRRRRGDASHPVSTERNRHCPFG